MRPDTQHPAGEALGSAGPGSLTVWYLGTLVQNEKRRDFLVDADKFVVERVQTGVRMEKRLLKVLKALAEYHDLTLGDLLEGIVLHVFEGKCPFGEANLQRIADLKKFYGLDLDSTASHRLKENRQGRKAGRGHTR
jgi:hypothetical protein